MIKQVFSTMDISKKQRNSIEKWKTLLRRNMQIRNSEHNPILSYPCEL